MGNQYFLQFSIGETSQTPPDIFTWKGIIAICVILMTLGYLIDFFLLKSGNRKILKLVGSWELKLAFMPIREWQHHLAKTLFKVKEILNPNTVKFLKLRGFLWQRSRIFNLCYLLSLMVLVIGLMVYEFWALKFPEIDISFFLRFGIVYFFVYWNIVFYKSSKFEFSGILLNKKDFFDWISPTIILYTFSIIFTSIALLCGNIFVINDNIKHYWYNVSDYEIAFNHVFQLILVNYIFDFLTIFITLYLIRLVLDNKLNIEIAALIDIVTSAFLTISLHTVLKVIESGKIELVVTNFLYATTFFIGLFKFQIPETNPDAPLTPLLLTTMIPVTFYMGLFIFLGFILKPITRFAGYICRIIFEKEKSPFFQISFILSLLVTLIKSLSEWEWFSFHLSKSIGIE